MGTITAKGKIVLGYLEKFPALPSRTIAKMVQESEHGHLFRDVEAARLMVRQYRGQLGEKNREKLTDKRFVLPEGTRVNPYSLPKQHNVKYANYVVPAALKRGVIITDIHIPYHCTKTLNAIIERMKKFDPDFIILAEVLDVYQMSYFCKDPTKPQMVDEINDARQFFTAIRTMFPKAHIIYHMCNHDMRFKYWMWQHPELYQVEEAQLEAILGLENLGIEVVTDKRVINIGHLPYMHGHELWRSIMNPVNPARGLFLKAKGTAACGHFHQTSEHTTKNIKQEIITCWSIGAACQLHPEYMPINEWNNGFAEIEKTPSGLFNFDNYRMLDGEIL